MIYGATRDYDFGLHDYVSQILYEMTSDQPPLIIGGPENVRALYVTCVCVCVCVCV